MSYKKKLDLLFYRAGETVDTPKGSKQTSIKLPKNYQKEDRWCHKSDHGEIIEIHEIDDDDLPSLDFANNIGKYELFSSYLPKHRKIASELIQIFMDCEDTDELISIAVYCRDLINPYLFFYALNIAILNREDTKDFHLPSIHSYSPDKFVDGKMFQSAREELTVVPLGSRVPITLPPNRTANLVYEEQYLAYFREDVGLSLYYWYWNLLYPGESCNLTIVDKNRRGELFYYTNQQIIARYNCERLCNKLFRVERLNNFSNSIPEGYFPKLDNQLASDNWPPRFTDTKLKDLNRREYDLKIDLCNLTLWSDRIKDAIDSGFVIDEKGEKFNLDIANGIDCLGNIIQSSMLSKNRKYYGNLSDAGHLFMAYCHDPDGKHLEPHGVIGEYATTLRDPLFYRWHSYIDYLFQLHKNCLPPYKKSELMYNEISITSIDTRFDSTTEGTVKNELHTFWQQVDMDLERGLDYSKNESIFVRLTQLNHHPFKYVIKVKNDSSTTKIGTVRIFMAPKYDETKQLFSFEEQRSLMIELDKFKCSLNPGANVITRKSEESSVSILYDNMFNNGITPFKKDKKNETFYCGCGWPQNLLIPKGHISGIEFCLFVMISNINDDRVDQGKIDKYVDDTTSYCSLPNRKYPDARPMGFPFDRKSHDYVNYLGDFLTKNMRTCDILIKFENVTVVHQPTPGVPPVVPRA